MTFLFALCFIVFHMSVDTAKTEAATHVRSNVTVGIMRGRMSANFPLWTREDVLRSAMDQLQAKKRYSTDVIFYSLPHYNMTSVGNCLRLLCENVVPQKVRVLLSTLGTLETQLVSQWAGLVDLHVIGTARSISLTNKQKYRNYYHLLPATNEQILVLLSILHILAIDEFAILRTDDQESLDFVANFVTMSKGMRLNYLQLNVTKGRVTKSEAVNLFLGVKRRGLRVLLVVCDFVETRILLEAADEVGLTSDQYLWIGTERVVGYIGRIVEALVPQRMIGVRLNVTQEEIAFRAAQLLYSIAESKLSPNCNRENSTVNTACRDSSNRALDLARNTQPPAVTNNTYDILERGLLENSSSRYFNVIAQWSSIHKNIYSEDFFRAYRRFRKTKRDSAKRLRIVTIEHGQYTYKVPNMSPKCPSNVTFCTNVDQSCEIGVPCTRYIRSNDSDIPESICVAGLMIELLNLIQSDLQFAYDLYLVRDSKYGGFDTVTGKWNGMIGDIIVGEADMALATLTITRSRCAVVDFSYAYGEVGIGLLTSVTNDYSPIINLDFLLPFSCALWVVIIVTITTVWTLIWILDKNTSTWYHKNRGEHTAIKKRIFFLESMSFAWSTFVHIQAGKGVPRSSSARLVALFFAFAMLIVSSSYTAELAAHKVKEKVTAPISGIFDDKMLNPPAGFKYGSLADSSTEAFFRFSEDPRLRRIYENMKGNNVQRVEDGVKKLISGELQVYIDDRPYLEHLVSSQLNCSLKVVGDSLATSGYGIALAKNSNWTNPFSLSIMKYNDKNILQDLWRKWLKRKCVRKEEFGKLPSGMTIKSVSGLFVVILTGIGVGMISLIIENGIYCLRQTKEDSVDITDQGEYNQREYNQRHAQSVPAEGSGNGVQLRHFSNKVFEGSVENIAR